MELEILKSEGKWQETEEMAENSQNYGPKNIITDHKNRINRGNKF
jgi:hypothetical protein